MVLLPFWLTAMRAGTTVTHPALAVKAAPRCRKGSLGQRLRRTHPRRHAAGGGSGARCHRRGMGLRGGLRRPLLAFFGWQGGVHGLLPGWPGAPAGSSAGCAWWAYADTGSAMPFSSPGPARELSRPLWCHKKASTNRLRLFYGTMGAEEIHHQVALFGIVTHLHLLADQEDLHIGW